MCNPYPFTQAGGFSMCSSPSRMEKENILDLAVKYSDWPPTHWLHSKAFEGCTIKLRFGGNFYYPCHDVIACEDHQVLLIAGGVGINPLASIFLYINDLLVGMYVG